MTEYQANVRAFQWDGTIAGTQAMQEFLGSTYKVTLLLGAWQGSEPQAVVQCPNHSSATLGAETWAVLMADGSVQAMTDGAFKVAYQAKPA